ENEIQRLETENEVRSKELAFRKRERNLAFAGLALLFGFLASLYLLFRRVKSQKTVLATQNNELDCLNKTLNHLFGIISHDLRNAAAAYRSSAKIISHHLKNGHPEKLLPLAPEIDKNARQLSALLENLLNWSIIQIKGIHLEKEMVSVKEILNGVVSLFEGLAGIKNNRVNLEAKDEKVWCDKESLQLILRNLVGNAVKFTGNGTITLKTSAAGEFTEITVSDTGCGMDNITADNIRNMIFAESRRGTMGEKGAGLGLMLVSEHISKNGGTFDVESSPGNGTRFIVKLPSTRK
ncbi:MAG: HAMP domain-containing histidine kinase, partial [Bacteroidia bacterium]|nr:HAMP domain-containing histidine kinase [Bacteroidia bacterium]